MPPEVLIRQLRQNDAGALRELDSRILGRDRSATWDRYVERFLRVADLETMILPPWGCHVAELHGDLIGFILAEWQPTGYGLPPGARIVAVAVHPAHRNRGIGRKLIEALAAECAQSGIDQVFSILRTEDERDIRFLQACGFDAASTTVLSRRI
ncbi:MAG: GNAT family N-acetyltransferase [Gemmatimonadetes bacterium]|nr:GNAT family N-acetyltransferase [Gemmatimonadota bacterium]